MNKSDLKNGDVVKTRDGELYLLIDGVGYRFPSMVPYLEMEEFREDLTDKDDYSGLDIVAVWKKSNNSTDAFLSFFKGQEPKWDWERKEQKTGRVTLDNVDVGEKYYFVDVYGEIVDYKYVGDEMDSSIIASNAFGAYYTKEEMQDVLYTYREIKKRKEEPCEECSWYTKLNYNYCPTCGRRLGVE